MYRSVFPYDIFNEMERLQRSMEGTFGFLPNIRGIGRGSFPALNIGGTSDSVEVYAFAPGLESDKIEIHVERSTLTISGNRPDRVSEAGDKSTVHLNERFAGAFRRIVSLPDDIDPDSISANYRDGVLHISIKRRQSAAPRRITVQ